jgi:hypothetical protein
MKKISRNLFLLGSLGMMLHKTNRLMTLLRKTQRFLKLGRLSSVFDPKLPLLRPIKPHTNQRHPFKRAFSNSRTTLNSLQ